MAPPSANPLQYTFDFTPPPLPRKEYPIAGILTTVYGLSELPPGITELACLWLLHPRLQTQECMAPLAALIVTEWNKRIAGGKAGSKPRGLIAVSFDARNHGTREVDKLANGAWRDGNPRHAMDMYASYSGTALDTSHLITLLPAYLFGAGATSLPITANIVYGVSLGGHATWHCALNDRRVGAAVSALGTPDYAALMRQRAEKSRRPSWTDTSPPGASFMGSTDFPTALQDALPLADPAAALSLRDSLVGSGGPAVKARLRRTFKDRLAGKRLLLLSGGADKLVPYAVNEPFLRYLKEAVGPGGFFADGGCVVEDVVFPGVGHELTGEMARKAQEWICGYLAGGDTGASGASKL